MKVFLLPVFLTTLLFSCSKDPDFTQVAPGSKMMDCDNSSLEFLRVEESSNNKKEIKVSTFNYFYPLRLFAVLDGIFRGETFKSLQNNKGIDVDLFKHEATELAFSRKDSFLTIHIPWGKVETLDPRIFLDKGDYILTAKKGCKNETSIIYDQQLTAKYIYTYGVDLIILKRDEEGDVESTLEFMRGDERDQYQYFLVDRKIATKYLPKIKIVATEAGFSGRRDMPVKQFLKLYRDQTYALKHNGSVYNFFELINSPYFTHRTNPDGFMFIPLFEMDNLTDMRRGVVFSFLKNQLEREEKEVDKSLLQFEVWTLK